MLHTFLSVLPIFCLVMTGFVAKKLLPHAVLWQGIEKLVYYLFFPVLLIIEVSKADFSNGGLFQSIVAPLVGTLIVAAVIFFSKVYFKIENSLFTSIFQGGTRYNSYVFIALAQSLFGNEGIVIAGVFMAYMIIAVNIMCISVMNIYGVNQNNKKGFFSIIIALVKNPLIIGVLIGLLLNYLDLQPTGAIKQYLLYLGNTATPLSLMSVGAGLIIVMDSKKTLAIFYSIFLKLLLLPAVTIILLYLMSASGLVANIALLFSAMPSAGNAYILSRQMGGDSEAMASIITWSTLLSIITIPIVIGLFEFAN